MKVAVFLRLIFLIGLWLWLGSKPPCLECVEIRVLLWPLLARVLELFPWITTRLFLVVRLIILSVKLILLGFLLGSLLRIPPACSAVGII